MVGDVWGMGYGSLGVGSVAPHLITRFIEMDRGPTGVDRGAFRLD